MVTSLPVPKVLPAGKLAREGGPIAGALPALASAELSGGGPITSLPSLPPGGASPREMGYVLAAPLVKAASSPVGSVAVLAACWA